MGTNYYARIIPSIEKKKELHDAIEANDSKAVKNLVGEMYEPLHLWYRYSQDANELVGGEVHLGKRSGGWKFLWNPNVYYTANIHFEDKNGTRELVNDGYNIYKIYDLTKASIKAFIDREDVEVYDEYDEKQDKEEFWEMALSWGGDNGLDSDAYAREYNERSSYDTDNSHFFEIQGYKLGKTKHDFYSDGLRFSVHTEFS